MVVVEILMKYLNEDINMKSSLRKIKRRRL